MTLNNYVCYFKYYYYDGYIDTKPKTDDLKNAIKKLLENETLFVER